MRQPEYISSLLVATYVPQKYPAKSTLRLPRPERLNWKTSACPHPGHSRGHWEVEDCFRKLRLCLACPDPLSLRELGYLGHAVSGLLLPVPHFLDANWAIWAMLRLACPDPLSRGPCCVWPALLPAPTFWTRIGLSGPFFAWPAQTPFLDANWAILAVLCLACPSCLPDPLSRHELGYLGHASPGLPRPPFSTRTGLSGPCCV